MKNLLFSAIVCVLFQSCLIKKAIRSCDYIIVLNEQVIDNAKDQKTIWLSTYSGIKLRKIQERISAPGMLVDFTLTVDNLKANVFDKICWIDNKKLDTVEFFIGDNNEILYSIQYIKQ